MAYWDAEADVPTLYVYDPQAATVLGPNFGIGIWKPLDDGSAHHWQDDYGTWCGPEVWIGPLSQPGGPFGGTICEADEDLHAKAMELKAVIVIEHKDFTHSKLSGGTWTACKIIEDGGK